MTYIDYIKKNSIEIKGIKRTYNPIINYPEDALKDLSTKSTSFGSALACIRDKQIGRQFIIDLFQKKNYLMGFWVTLLWGNLQINNLKYVAEDERKTDGKENSITKRLESVDNYLKNGSIKEAFDSLSDKGKNKIEGVGISFFTKLLYFMGMPYSIHPLPLIYDKWTRGIDAVLISEKINPVSDNYTLVFGPRGGFRLPAFPKGATEYSIYKNYLMRMECVAKSINTNPDKLEEFLFGVSQVHAALWNNNNPRYVLQVNYLSPLCKYPCNNGSRTNIKNQKKNTKRKASNNDVENGIVVPTGSPLKEVKVTQIEDNTDLKGRKPLEGYRIHKDGNEFCLFIGEDKRKLYCEILSIKGGYPQTPSEQELFDDGFVKKGGNNPYYLKSFKINEIDNARCFMNIIKLKYWPEIL